MPTLNQLIRHGREEKRRTDRTRASDQCPQKQGVRPRVPTRTPKKPNSAPRKIAKVRLSNRHDISAHIPYLVLIGVLILFFLVCMYVGAIPFFIVVVEKGAALIAVKFLSFLLARMGLSGASAMLLGCALRAFLTAEASLPVEKLMFLNETSGASGSELTLEQAVLSKKEEVRTFLIDGISRYLELFEKDILNEYPDASVRIGTIDFFERFRKSLVSDYGLENPSPSSLTTLKNYHDILKRDLSFLEEENPYFKNNIYYDNLRSVMLEYEKINSTKLD